MKIHKHIIVSLISAIFTVIAVYGGYTIYAAGDEPDGNFRAPGLDFDEALDLYHEEMNYYFNNKIEQLNTLLMEEDFFEKEEFKTPGDKVCADENVSTYCVSNGALDIYLDYVFTLDRISTELSKLREDDDVEDIFERTLERNQKIAPEYDIAKQAMEATLAAYNEYRLAFPAHKKYRIKGFAKRNR
ncbi:hypothetical protein HYW82_04185 [Candidatus Peregrinibacteria bacterium]|nr:hypothetical protein [Candidatus Peregrinibacteria bacterium]